MRAFQSPQRRRLSAAIDRGLPADTEPRQRSVFLGAAALGLACHALSASATTYVVDTGLDPGPGGTTSLRQAIFQANASANNIIQFAPALNGSTLTLQNGEIVVTEPMYIVGPGPDKLTISGNDASRIFNISTVSATPIAVTLSGLTLTHANASGFGGAIWAGNVSLTLENSVLDYNAAVFGAGIYSSSPYATVSVITGTTISKNTATRGGGLYFSGGSSLHIADSVLDSNTGTTKFGGGRLNRVSSVSIERTRITNNKSQSLSGAGLSIDSHNAYVPTAQISASSITSNTAGSDGGGLYLSNVFATLTSDTISGNSANNGGGIFVYDSQATPTTQLTLQRSTISGNSASTFGGGVNVQRASSIYIQKSLISGNNTYNFSGGGGGGIALQSVSSQASLYDSTFYANYAYNNGGGIGIFDAATGNNTKINGTTIAGNLTFNYESNGILGAGVPFLYNCVAANNSSHTISQDISGTFQELYSLVRTVGTANIVGAFGNKNGQDPHLGPLAVNGGPTLTMMPALSSPVLDAGGPSPSGTDQRGLPRSANGRRDMGAVERQYPEDIIFRSGFDSS
jgi:hypothetical protein